VIVVYRAWSVRRVETGRFTLQRSPRWEVARGLGWFAEGQPDEWPPLDLLFGAERVPELAETLVGMAHNPAMQDWEPGLSAARCVTFGHTPPHDHGGPGSGDPGCGFYGMKPGHGLPVGPPSAGWPGGCLCRIPGLAGLSGEVTETERGWRASHARVLALLVPPAWGDLRHHLYAPYGSYGPGCSCPMHAAAAPGQPDDDPDATELAESHVVGLADRYGVPVFRGEDALRDYAARLEQPVTWPVEDVAPPEEVDWGGRAGVPYHWGGIV
jgi:hypothetical protein